MDVVADYGQDTVDLVLKIEKFLDRKLEHKAFGDGIYIEHVEFCMTDIPNIGAFVVKFPETSEFIVAGINMNSGDYYLNTTDFGTMKLEIYEMSDVNITRLIERAEYEWSMDSQEMHIE